MDGGSGLNIMYAEMLGAAGIDRLRVRPIEAPFHYIKLGKQAIPLEDIDLPITFKDPTNYRMETLTFEVVRPAWGHHCQPECKVECCEHASVIITSEELAVIKEGTAKEAPNSKQSIRSYEPMEGVNEVLIDPSTSEDKVVRIGTTLSSK
ncbi:uncharacterized protein [Miscanthus floridulus]|uniref:uncharacterized protein n=1 Tax=Miscanthus floridulus TaxID=154761 RepID=UPI00345B2F98